MGISWSGDTLSIAVQKAGNSILESIKASANDILPELAMAGKDEMHRKMENTRSAIVDKEDRIHSGEMFTSTTFTDVMEHKKNVYTVEYGWPHGALDYFLVQDHGGWTDDVYLWNGERGYISPMHSMLGAYTYTNEEFIREAIRRWG